MTTTKEIQMTRLNPFLKDCLTLGQHANEDTFGATRMTGKRMKSKKRTENKKRKTMMIKIDTKSKTTWRKTQLRARTAGWTKFCKETAL